MLPAISWPVVLYLILFGFARLTSGKNASVFICMDRFHSVCAFFIPASCLFVFVPCYTVSHICCCWGVGFLAGGGVGGPVLGFQWFSPGGGGGGSLSGAP